MLRPRSSYTFLATGVLSLALGTAAVVTPQLSFSSASDAGDVTHPLPAALKWTRPVVRVVIIRDENWTAERQERALSGFREWKPFTGVRGTPRFVVLSSDEAVGDVNVWFVPDGVIGGRTVGLTRWSHDNGNIGGASMLLSFADSPGDDSRQTSTAAHELGHALGITFHSANMGDLMFESSTGKAVGPADVARLRASYTR